jgi:predicted transcriptional regulator
MNGSKLRKQVKELGLSIAELSRVSDVSTPTITKIFSNLPVRASNRMKVYNGFRRLKAELEGQLEPTNVTGGPKDSGT